MKIGLYTPSIDSTIIRPAIVSIVSDLLYLLRIDSKIDKKIIEEFEGYDLKNLKRWTIIADDKDFGSLKEEILLINYKNNTGSPDIYLTTNQEVRPPVMLDSEIGVSVTPNYSSTKIDLNLSYFTKSRTNKSNLVSRLRNLAHSNRLESLGSITYYYYPKNTLFEILDEVNKLRTDGKTLPEYIDAICDDRVTDIKNLGNDSHELVFKENQHGVVIRILSDAVNVATSFDRETGYWQIDIDITFTFDSVYRLVTEYPHMVGVNLLPEKYRTVYNPNRADGVKVFKSGDMGWLSYVEQVNMSSKLLRGRKYVNIPYYDKHKPTETPMAGVKVFSVLTTIEDDKLFNINELPDIELHTEWSEFLKTEYEHIGKPRDSIIHFHIEDMSGKIVDDDVKIDSEGNLTTSRALDNTVAFRLFFNVIEDIFTLNGDVLDRVPMGLIIDTFTITTNSPLTDDERYVSIKHRDFTAIDKKRAMSIGPATVTLVAYILKGS